MLDSGLREFLKRAGCTYHFLLSGRFIIINVVKVLKRTNPIVSFGRR
jgi:hypothetical protein